MATSNMRNKLENNYLAKSLQGRIQYYATSYSKSDDQEGLIVRIFAILDRRVGKRRLLAMKAEIGEEPEMFQLFYTIRMEAEKLL